MQLTDLRDTLVQYRGVVQYRGAVKYRGAIQYRGAVRCTQLQLSKTLLCTLIFFTLRRFLPNRDFKPKVTKSPIPGDPGD
jgi:hypothetical protein